MKRMNAKATIYKLRKNMAWVYIYPLQCIRCIFHSNFHRLFSSFTIFSKPAKIYASLPSASILRTSGTVPSSAIARSTLIFLTILCRIRKSINLGTFVYMSFAELTMLAEPFIIPGMVISSNPFLSATAYGNNLTRSLNPFMNTERMKLS